jgi:D-glycero-beta-D-manno-heptose-7-phosphate kinase
MGTPLKLKPNQKRHLVEAIQRFPNYRVLVVGDLILDVFIWGKVQRISPEAPVPVVEVAEETRLLGGAANVVSNLAALGSQACVTGIIGEDVPGSDLAWLLRQLSIPTDGLFADAGRPTTIKTRIIAHHQQVVRFDREWRKAPGSEATTAILTYVQDSLESIDGVIVSDYGKGIITLELMEGIRALLGRRPIPLMVDPKIQNMDLYREVTMITPNNQEASMMSGIPIEDESSLLAAGQRLLELCRCQMGLVTRGEAGMTLFQQNAPALHIPTVARRVFDVTGAGDTVISTITVAMLAGLSPADAAVLANIAAGIVVGEIGIATVSATRLKEAVRHGL